MGSAPRYAALAAAGIFAAVVWADGQAGVETGLPLPALTALEVFTAAPASGNTIIASG